MPSTFVAAPQAIRSEIDVLNGLMDEYVFQGIYTYRLDKRVSRIPNATLRALVRAACKERRCSFIYQEKHYEFKDSILVTVPVEKRVEPINAWLGLVAHDVGRNSSLYAALQAGKRVAVDRRTTMTVYTFLSQSDPIYLTFRERLRSDDDWRKSMNLPLGAPRELAHAA